jgi:hypothetical protein
MVLAMKFVKKTRSPPVIITDIAITIAVNIPDISYTTLHAICHPFFYIRGKNLQKSLFLPSERRESNPGRKRSSPEGHTEANSCGVFRVRVKEPGLSGTMYVIKKQKREDLDPPLHNLYLALFICCD